MSNPLINRWGSNLFWYNIWYSDKNSSLWIKQDYLINQLITTYINFGLSVKKNIFADTYWHFKKKINLLDDQNSFNYKYVRMLEHKNKVTGEITKFSTRAKAKNLYNSKLWILKYQNWIVISFYAFQPITRKRRAKKIKKNISFPLENKKLQSKKALYLIRLKILSTLLITNFFPAKSSYYFF